MFSTPSDRYSLTGDTLQCGYHGLEFDATGACVKASSLALRVPGMTDEYNRPQPSSKPATKIAVRKQTLGHPHRT